MRRRSASLLSLLLLLGMMAGLFLPASALSQVRARVVVRPALDSLIRDEDTDGDKRITIDDPHIAGTLRGDKRFWFPSERGGRYEVSGTYHLANLLALLKRAEDAGKDTISFGLDDLFVPPADHIAQSIKAYYWAGLTRRIDAGGLATMIKDEKTRSVDGLHYVYVPPDDSLAAAYFSGIARDNPALAMKVVVLPRNVTPQYVKSLNGRHGILSLKLQREPDGTISGLPFVVPGGRFNEMYGWDSYFISLGLLEDGKVNLAKSMVDNFVYEIEQYGKILNANRTYYLTRSQPPFLTSMALAVYERLPQNAHSKQWLARAMEAAIHEYKDVWTNKDHETSIGLSRYFDPGLGPPPEVEPGRYDAVFTAYAKRHNMTAQGFEHAYQSGIIHDAELDKFFTDDRSMRESGHDASYRLLNDCAELATVDLNSLLYKIESDLAQTIRSVFGGTLTLHDGTTERSAPWEARAKQRKQLLTKYLWNEERGMFFDYDIVQRKQISYVSATTLFPLWARVATPKQAERLVRTALPLLAMPGGIVGSTESSRGAITDTHPQTQWDYPFGWAPHQMLTWKGLRNYGYDTLARDLAFRWLYTVAVNAANYNGTIAEKYDVVDRSSQVFAEYGNVGTKFSYLTREGFGWTNASFVVGLTYLTAEDRRMLNSLIPPEWRFSGPERK
ncbi:MAG: trehalase family glycosidase [Bacteroidota bacterium]